MGIYFKQVPYTFYACNYTITLLKPQFFLHDWVLNEINDNNLYCQTETGWDEDRMYRLSKIDKNRSQQVTTNHFKNNNKLIAISTKFIDY